MGAERRPMEVVARLVRRWSWRLSKVAGTPSLVYRTRWQTDEREHRAVMFSRPRPNWLSTLNGWTGLFLSVAVGTDGVLVYLGTYFSTTGAVDSLTVLRRPPLREWRFEFADPGFLAGLYAVISSELGQ